MNNFTLSGIPVVEFGHGSIQKLNAHLGKYGKNILLISGSKSLEEGGLANDIRSDLKKDGFVFFEEKISFEPTPAIIDSITNKYRKENIEALCAIGGGSVLDTGKAVAAMLKEKEGVKTYLETVGLMKPSGKTLPVIAVPTTSGTGSEATKNAVVSETGTQGFKSSLRHDNYIPKVAIIDPSLTLSCPPYITACCGLDALSQLIESYLSTQATPFTDALAFDGIRRIFNSLQRACLDSPHDIHMRSELSYAAFISGITLAHAGLCVVHGLASTLGYRTTAPHGLICGLLLPEWLKMTSNYLIAEDNKSSVLYTKFTNLTYCANVPAIRNYKNSFEPFISFVENLYSNLNLPKLSGFGLSKSMIPEIASSSGNKNNPYPITQKEREFLLNRIL